MSALLSRRNLILAGYGAAAVGFGVALGWLALREMTWGRMGELLLEMHPGLLALALITILASSYVRALSWHLLLGRDQATPRRLFLIQQAGLALNALSVLRILDEAIEVSILAVHDRVETGRVLASEAMQRTLEFSSVVVLMGGAALVIAPLRPYWPYVVGGMGIAIVALVLLFTVGPAMTDWKFLRRFRVVREFTHAAGLMRQYWVQSATAFGLSVASTVLVGLSGWFVGLALGLDASLPAFLVVTLASRLFVSFVPGLPFAFGTLEFAAVSLLGLWDISSTQALTFTQALRGVLYIPPILIALVFLSTEGLLSFKALRGLTQQRQERRAEGQKA